jgi:hypothetical protein
MVVEMILGGARRLRGCRLVLIVALLMPALSRAQNPVKNPGFEEPLGPDNWTVVYTGVLNAGPNAPTNCGPADFLIAGRTLMSHMKGAQSGECDFGGHFAPNHRGLMHAYFKQTVTGLKPGAGYTVSAWMSQYTRNPVILPKVEVYLEALGGPNADESVLSPYARNNSTNDNPGGWKKYQVATTASQRGQIEVRLHFNKIGFTGKDKCEWRNINAFYDHVEVVPAGQSPTASQP